MSWEIVLFYWVGWFVIVAFLLLLGLFFFVTFYDRYTEHILTRNMFWKAVNLFTKWQDENPDWKQKLKPNKPWEKKSLLKSFIKFIFRNY